MVCPNDMMTIEKYIFDLTKWLPSYKNIIWASILKLRFQLKTNFISIKKLQPHQPLRLFFDCCSNVLKLLFRTKLFDHFSRSSKKSRQWLCQNLVTLSLINFIKWRKNERGLSLIWKLFFGSKKIFLRRWTFISKLEKLLPYKSLCCWELLKYSNIPK